jgi:hypothetical protein
LLCVFSRVLFARCCCSASLLYWCEMLGEIAVPQCFWSADRASPESHYWLFQNLEHSFMSALISFF